MSRSSLRLLSFAADAAFNNFDVPLTAFTEKETADVIFTWDALLPSRHNINKLLVRRGYRAALPPTHAGNLAKLQTRHSISTQRRSRWIPEQRRIWPLGC